MSIILIFLKASLVLCQSMPFRKELWDTSIWYYLFDVAVFGSGECNTLSARTTLCHHPHRF